MPSHTRLEWNGDQLLARVAEAARQAIDDVTEAVDRDATASHWWRPRTGYLERRIITEPAQIKKSHVTGRVGATYSGQKGLRSGFYALFLEYKVPWLRPATDRHFPTLAEHIRRRLRGR